MPQDQIKKFNLKVIKNWWEEVKDWPEAKKRVLVYIFLAVLAIPFLVLAGMNFKYQASKLGLQPILKTDLNSTGTAELRNSLNEVLEANKQLDQNLKLMEEIDNSLTTSERETMLQDESSFDFESTSTIE